MTALGTLGWLIGTTLALCTACNTTVPPDSRTVQLTASAASSPCTSGPEQAPMPAAVALPPRAGATEASSAVASSKPAARAAKKSEESALVIKRWVVSPGVKDREPLATDAAFVADGSAIFAFVELANPSTQSEEIRITFERKGGAERVGNVTLPVPAQTGRYRTWASTRFIRAPGEWEAVLWSESGKELSRAKFEVASAS